MGLEFGKLMQEAELEGYQLEEFCVVETEEVTEIPEQIRTEFAQLDLALEQFMELSNDLYGIQTTTLTPQQKNMVVLRHNAVFRQAPQLKLSQEDFLDATLSMEEDFKERFVNGLNAVLAYIGPLILTGIEFVKDMMDSTQAALRRCKALREKISDYSPPSKIRVNKRRLRGAFDDGYGKWLSPETVMPQLHTATKHVFGNYWRDVDSWIRSAKTAEAPDSMGLNTYFDPLPRQIQFQMVAERYHYLNVGKPQVMPGDLYVDAPSSSKLNSLVDATEDTLRILQNKQTGIISTLKILDAEGSKLRKALGGTLQIMFNPDTAAEYKLNVASIRVKSRLAINVVKTFAAYALALCEYSNQYVALVLGSK